MGIIIGVAGELYIFPRSTGDNNSQELINQLDLLNNEINNLKQQVNSMTYNSGLYDEFVSEVDWYKKNNNSIVTIMGDVMVDEWTGVAYAHYLPFELWISMLESIDEVTDMQVSKQDLRVKVKDMREILDEISEDPALGEPRIFVDTLGKYLGFIYYEADWETTMLYWIHLD